MSIGSTIKCLRREKNITQEQLAQYLGITSRAVSQWECNRTAPDISQLPALCHIFNVTSDTLLGIDTERAKEEIQRYLKEASTLGNQGKGCERTALLREANKRFPRDYTIMQRLADSLVCEYSLAGNKDYEEVFVLCHRILAECTDSTTRYEAIDTLGTAYEYAGKTEEMLKLAKEMPRTCFSYESFMVYRWTGDKAFSERQEYISFLMHELLQMIICLPGHRGDDGKAIIDHETGKTLHRLALRLLDAFFPDGDYQYFAQYAEGICDLLVSDAQRTHDTEALWDWLNKKADFAIHSDTYDFEAPHTSPILCGYADGGWIMGAEGNRSRQMLSWLLQNEDFAVLRTDHRYGALIARLETVANNA